MKRLFLQSLLLTLALLASIGAEAWVSPTNVPTGNNSNPPIRVGSLSETKEGGLTLNTGASPLGLSVALGSVVIGANTATGLFSIKAPYKASVEPCTSRCGNIYVPSGGAYNGGYSFTPLTNGRVTGFKARLQASGSNFTVRLYNQATQAVLASATLVSAGPSTWVSTTITPVTLSAGQNYIVAVGGPQVGYSNPPLVGATYPFTVGDIRVNDTRLSTGGTSAFPTISNTSEMWGNTDVIFESEAMESAFTVLSNGNVGVGVSNPTSKLSLRGSVQVGSDSGSCDSGRAGTMRSSSGVLELCNGSSWSYLNPPTPCGASGGCLQTSHGATCTTYATRYSNSCPPGVTHTCANGTWSSPPGPESSCSLPPSCPASGACPLTAHGGTCSSNYESSSASCQPNHFSTCNYGVWQNPTPGAFASCAQILTCSADGACGSGNEGDTCNTYPSDTGNPCVSQQSTCTGGSWSPGPQPHGYCADE